MGVVVLLLITACAREPAGEPVSVNLDVPAWAGDAIWYQIFVERASHRSEPSEDAMRGPPNGTDSGPTNNGQGILLV
jgi:hypothetical protein